MATNTTTAEDRLAKLGIHLPDAPTPFGAYVPAVQTGNLLFLSGMLATSGHTATVVGIVGKDLDVKAGREAAHLAALNVLALTKKQLGSLNRVSRVVSFIGGSAARQLQGSGVAGVVGGQCREGVSKRSALPQAGLNSAKRVARTPRNERPRTGIWAGDHPSRRGSLYDTSGPSVEVADRTLVLCAPP
jgi:enamine deaminase RidA (YjgF/YER057c/UK114 family)